MWTRGALLLALLLSCVSAVSAAEQCCGFISNTTPLPLGFVPGPCTTAAIKRLHDMGKLNKVVVICVQTTAALCSQVPATQVKAAALKYLVPNHPRQQIAWLSQVSREEAERPKPSVSRAAQVARDAPKKGFKKGGVPSAKKKVDSSRQRDDLLTPEEAEHKARGEPSWAKTERTAKKDKEKRRDADDGDERDRQRDRDHDTVRVVAASSKQKDKAAKKEDKGKKVDASLAATRLAALQAQIARQQPQPKTDKSAPPADEADAFSALPSSQLAVIDAQVAQRRQQLEQLKSKKDNSVPPPPPPYEILTLSSAGPPPPYEAPQLGASMLAQRQQPQQQQLQPKKDDDEDEDALTLLRKQEIQRREEQQKREDAENLRELAARAVDLETRQAALRRRRKEEHEAWQRSAAPQDALDIVDEAAQCCCVRLVVDQTMSRQGGHSEYQVGEIPVTCPADGSYSGRAAHSREVCRAAFTRAQDEAAALSVVQSPTVIQAGACRTLQQDTIRASVRQQLPPLPPTKAALEAKKEKKESEEKAKSKSRKA